MRLPRGIGPFHIVGIGGIGMSAIAEVLVSLGYAVQGSDLKNSPNVERLRQRGIRVFVGHNEVNLVGARYVVVSSAIRQDNAELQAARARGLPIIRRAEMLAELMRMRATVSVTGTHGKTTTTSLIAHILEHAGQDPTVISGGIIRDWQSNARIGNGQWMVVEADESDGTFTRLPTQIGVVTNADPEHLDFYGNVEAMHDAYRTFLDNIPFYGLAVAGVDHPVIRDLLRERAGDARQQVVTYGQSDDADLRLRNLRFEGADTVFDLDITQRVAGGERTLEGLRIPVPGAYNALNAAAAFAVATEIGLSDDAIRDGIASFGGVSRRFTPTGEWEGVRFYDDYAHHPVEIKSLLDAARQTTSGRVVAIFQPHRYSRLNDLFDDFARCFAAADLAVIAPVFAAGERAIAGVDHKALCEAIRASGTTNALAIASEGQLPPVIAEICRPGDVVLGIGAGSITEWSHALPGWMAAHQGEVSRQQSGGIAAGGAL